MGVVSASSGAAAAPGIRTTFKPVPAGSKITKLPAGMRNRPVTVMVQLGEQPVAAADADAAASPSRSASSAAIRRQARPCSIQ